MLTLCMFYQIEKGQTQIPHSYSVILNSNQNLRPNYKNGISRVGFLSSDSKDGFEQTKPAQISSIEILQTAIACDAFRNALLRLYFSAEHSFYPCFTTLYLKALLGFIIICGGIQSKTRISKKFWKLTRDLYVL